MTNILFNMSTLFICSMLLNFALFSLIKLGFLGEDLKSLLKDLISKNLNLFCFIIFILSFFIFVYLKSNAIFLEDDKVIITTTLKEGTFVISGDFLNSIFTNIGSAAVFTAGARIAASLVAKHPIHLLPKTGIIGGTAAGFTATFRLISNYTPGLASGADSIVQTGPVEIKIEGFNNLNDETFQGFLKNKLFNSSSQIKFPSPLKEGASSNTYKITGNLDETNKVISELEKVDPNWKDKFIPSPLESDSSLTQFVVEALNTHLFLNFIIVYLLVMLLLIFICKLVLNKNTEFQNLNKYPLGNLINKILVKYISIWQTSGNVWIFLILGSLIFFNLVTLYSFYSLIKILT